MKTPQELYEEVRTFQPAEILQYLADKESISLTDATERWDEMLKFLVLCATSEKVHAPSEAVDAAWHAFVLHTEQYEAFCLTHLGRFVHHRPKVQPFEEFANSVEEIFTVFPNSPVRKHLWLAVGDCEDGGSQCVANCAEVGCHRVVAQRAFALPSLVAVSAH